MIAFNLRNYTPVPLQSFTPKSTLIFCMITTVSEKQLMKDEDSFYPENIF